MRVFLPLTAALLAAASQAVAKKTDSCSVSAKLCPACNYTNVTDVDGMEWAISCDYEISSADEETLHGNAGTEACLAACDTVDGCYAVNMAANGTCALVTGEQRALVQRMGYTNLVRLTASTPTSSSTSIPHVHITSTVFGNNLTHNTVPSTISISSTTSASTSAASPSTVGKCDLELDDLCPSCDGRQVEDVNGTAYTIVCESALDPTNGTYYVQKALTPEECLEQCNDMTQAGILCHGASYFDYRDCELAKGVASVTSKASFTAFIPVATAASGKVTPKSVVSPTTAEPTFSTLPISSGCNSSAPTCPACNGFPIEDKVNATYTIECFEPICDSEPVFDDVAESMERCMESCDQDAECLAVKWYPRIHSCHHCNAGLDESTGTNLPYVLLVAGNYSDDTSSSSSVLPSATSYGSITDFPHPFPTAPPIVSSESRLNASFTITPVHGPATATHTSSITLAPYSNDTQS